MPWSVYCFPTTVSSVGQVGRKYYLDISIQGFPGGSVVKNPPAMQELQEMQVPSLGWEDPLEESMATHSSALAWRIPRTGESGRLWATGSQRVGQGNSTHAPVVGFPGNSAVKNLPTMQETRRRCGFGPWPEKVPWRRKWQLTLIFFPGESHGQRSLVGYSP